MTPSDVVDWFPAAMGALMILCAAGCIPFLFWNLWKLTQLEKRK